MLHDCSTPRDYDYECSENSQYLVMPATQDEVRRFRRIVASLRNPRSVYIGAVLVDVQGTAVNVTYKYLWQWIDGRTAISINISSWESPPRCVYYSPGDGYFSLDCQKNSQTDIICQFDKQNTLSRNEGKVGLITSVSSDLDDTIWKVSMVQCQSSHVTRDFLPCDTQDEYGLNECLTSCHSGIVSIPMFVCEHSHEALHYTLVCDHIRHCEDNTDEEFCLHRACLRLSSFQCQNGQCIAEAKCAT